MNEKQDNGKKKGWLRIIVYIFCVIGIISLGSKLYAGLKRGTSFNLQNNSQKNNLENSSLDSYKQNIRGLTGDVSYSFFIDEDRDGLSNAKEFIYGTNPRNQDTDEDGFSDGEEVKKGYDPLIRGQAWLKDRHIYNYSIDYFSWLQDKTGIIDPQIGQDKVDEFFREKLGGKIDLLYPDDTDIALDSKRSIASYFEEVAKVRIPQPEKRYTEVIQNPETIDFDNLKDLIAKFELTYADLKQIKVPEKAKDYHFKLLVIVRNMALIFKDVSSFYLDPVKIHINNYKFYELIKIGFESEVLKKQLLEQK